MRLRRKPGVAEALKQYEGLVVAACTGGGWQREFGRTAPLHVELGVGKGTFISELAAREPGINFVGIEAQPEVIFQAAKRVIARGVPNVRLLHFDANGITEIFSSGEVGRLYINFCDPWPKKRHAKRRLTSGLFLTRYRGVMAPGGELFFKTDNAELFAFSLEEFAKAGLEVRNVSFDLPADAAGNIMTEYETRFRSLGVKINRCEVVFP
ncbi:tRNA (guanosine(46)-N7)-methyltransferase TrmB [Anaeroselena agilis]|uniref:tRNA (guanine-N(7)-)-methyltransferase n=1 Tax=Anaeroselena agilis TaxID=3063788 RepID=A0ABU3P287_9FIRM|nr:tRNA (guanosine(46)-N7)-methyltransferase TrmB [Selenomonadales bacterium 4137-cl]